MFKSIIEAIGQAIDVMGVLVIVIGLAGASARYIPRARSHPDAFRLYRQTIGRATLLGLEFLVAGDIIRTVGVAPTLPNVLVLGLIVLVRTVLSLSIQVELEGQWPWRAGRRRKTVSLTQESAAI